MERKNVIESDEYNVNEITCMVKELMNTKSNDVYSVKCSKLKEQEMEIAEKKKKRKMEEEKPRPSNVHLKRKKH